MSIRPASDRSLLVSLGDEISLETHLAVFRLTRRLKGLRPIVNLHPAFASVLVEFDPRVSRAGEIEKLIRSAMGGREGETDLSPAAIERRLELPVVYGGQEGPDLEEVARHTGLAAERVVELHSSAEYRVYFLGFATGFAYLGGLPPELATPRLGTPRRMVPAGSVGIADGQAGIYPLASPGGWRLIGRTPVRLFDPEATPPPLLRMGDRVRFVPKRGSGL